MMVPTTPNPEGRWGVEQTPGMTPGGSTPHLATPKRRAWDDDEIVPTEKRVGLKP